MAVKILAQTLQVSNHCQFPYSQTEKKHLETHPSQPKVTNWVALERWLERHRRGGPRSCWRDNTSLWMGRQCPVQEMPYPEYVGTGRDTGTTRHLFFFQHIPGCVGLPRIIFFILFSWPWLWFQVWLPYDDLEIFKMILARPDIATCRPKISQKRFFCDHVWKRWYLERWCFCMVFVVFIQ